MNSLTREVIVAALGRLADRLQADQPRVDLIVVGGAAMVLLFGVRDSTKDVDAFHLDPDAKSRVAAAAAAVAECTGIRAGVWRQVEPHLVPGREMKAQYAFDDLWESEHGPA